MPQKSGQLTKNQNLVLEELNTAQTPLSAYTILDNLRGEGFRAPLQVYRALEKLIRAGLVHRLESTNSFVACRNSGCDEHNTIVFTICDTCTQTEELTNQGLSRQLNELANSRSFGLERAVIELHGVCDSCAGSVD